MGLISQNVSSTETSSPSKKPYSDSDITSTRDLPRDITDLVKPSPQYPRVDDTTIAREEANARTYTNKTAYDPMRYPETYGTLMQYVSGTPIRVTYYRHIRSDESVQTDFSDNDYYEDNVHVDLEQILNFEFRTESQFSFNWDTDKNESNFSGEGIVYPGFEVSVGDMFTYKIGDAIGLFKIDSFEPLSIRQGSYHKITFSLYSRVDNQMMNWLVSRTGSTVVFDLQKYMSAGLVLLKTESYVHLEQLRSIRVSLAKYYSNRFYDRNIHTYMRPDGVYDPYLVTYMSKKISAFDTKLHAVQLVTIHDYDNSVWSLFTEDRHTSLNVINRYSTTKRKLDEVFSSQINGIINKDYVTLQNTPTDTIYVLSEDMYNMASDCISGMEKLVYEYLTIGTIDAGQVIQLVQDFRKLTDDELFYRGAVYLHLIDTAIRSIT